MVMSLILKHDTPGWGEHVRSSKVLLNSRLAVWGWSPGAFFSSCERNSNICPNLRARARILRLHFPEKLILRVVHRVPSFLSKCYSIDIYDMNYIRIYIYVYVYVITGTIHIHVRIENLIYIYTHVYGEKAS